MGSSGGHRCPGPRPHDSGKRERIALQELDIARQQALTRRASVSVIFHANEKVFGIDRNGNGRLEAVEAEELPDGVEISEDAVVTFASSGSLAAGSRQPNIVISNTAKSSRVSVSKSGSVVID